MTAPTPSPSSPLDSNPEVEARMLVAQAWCTKANAHKVMDPELANAVAEIFTPHIKRHRMLSSQIDDLANFIMREIPGEPSQSQGAVDTAIRLLRAYRAPTNQQGADPGQPAAGVVEAAREAIRILNMVGEAPVGRVKAGQAATALETALSAPSQGPAGHDSSLSLGDVDFGIDDLHLHIEAGNGVRYLDHAEGERLARWFYAWYLAKHPYPTPTVKESLTPAPVPAAPAPAVDLEKKRLREAIDRISFCWNMGEIKKICAETLSDPLATYPGSASTGPTEGQS